MGLLFAVEVAPCVHSVESATNDELRSVHSDYTVILVGFLLFELDVLQG